jgi:hypothetical protein
MATPIRSGGQPTPGIGRLSDSRTVGGVLNGERRSSPPRGRWSLLRENSREVRAVACWCSASMTMKAL